MVPEDKDTRYPKARLTGAPGFPGHILTLSLPFAPIATADGCCAGTPEGYMADNEDSEQESKNMEVIFFILSYL